MRDTEGEHGSEERFSESGKHSSVRRMMPLMGELTWDQMGVTYVSDILKQESGFSDTKAKVGPGQAQGPPPPKGFSLKSGR